MKYALSFIIAAVFTAVATAAEPTVGKVDLGDFMLHYESSPASTSVSLYGRKSLPSLGFTKENDKSLVFILWTEKDGVSTFYTDTDGDGIFDQALVRSMGSVKKFRIKTEMIEIKPE